MSRRSWVVTAALLGLACAGGTPAREDAQADTVRLKVSVFNDARVPLPVLRAAELRARAVYRERCPREDVLKLYETWRKELDAKK